MAVVVSEDGCGRRNDMFRRNVSPDGVVVGRERGCGHRNHMLRWLLKVLVIAKNELGGREIEVAEGVVISTPSTTYLLGLPYHGSPLSFSYPPTSAPLLQIVAHIPR